MDVKKTHRCIARPYGPKGTVCGGLPENHRINKSIVRVWKEDRWEEFPLHPFEIGGRE